MALAGVGVLVVGCGGGGSSAGSTASETTAATAKKGDTGQGFKGQGSSAVGGSGGAESGKSESTSGGGGAGITDSGFVKRANEICKERKKQSLEDVSAYVEKQRGAGGGAPLAHLGEAIHAVLIPAIVDQVNEIRSLEVSGTEKAKVEKFVRAMEEGVENAEQAQGNSLTFVNESFERSSELAREYGLSSCAY